MICGLWLQNGLWFTLFIFVVYGFKMPGRIVGGREREREENYTNKNYTDKQDDELQSRRRFMNTLVKVPD